MAISVQSSSPAFQNDLETTNVRAMSIATMLFFMWGFLTSLNDILIPHLKSIFSLSYAEALLVQFAFFSSYAIFAFPAGMIVDWIGYKRTMVVGLGVMAAGALLFLPAATTASFALFLGALIVLAAGITTLQVAANPYVANLGPERTASSRLNLSQAFNSFGTFLAPLFGGLLILGSATALSQEKIKALSAGALQAYRTQEASTVRMPYAGIALALLALAVGLALIKLPPMSFTQDIRPGELNPTTHDSIWRHSQLLLGALGIFLYVGAEVSIGSFLINYFGLPEIGHLTEASAAKYVSLYWGGAMIGRFAGSWLLTKVRTSLLLGLFALVATVLVGISMASFGGVAMWSIILVGLFNSIMFPSIFTIGLEGLGALTSKGSSLIVCAIVGGAIVPELEGVIADRIGLHHAFFIPVLCYIYIAIFAFTRRRTSLTAAAPLAGA